MPCFADHAIQCQTEILANDQVATGTYRLRVVAPDIASSFLPGQFCMIRIPGGNDPLIGRAFAVYDRQFDANGQPYSIDFVYVSKGRMTVPLSGRQPGQLVELWGPLGNCFSTEPVEHLIFVAGGVGQTPFLTYGKAALGLDQYGDASSVQPFADRVTICYGARNSGYLAGVEDFKAAGFDVQIATDDGSIGPPQLVTDVLTSVLDQNTSASVRIATCGPEPMMAAVARIAAQRGLPCQVSLETPMACGIGICFTCVAPVKTSDGQWDYKRTCVEGPIFSADEIAWDV